MSLTLGRSTKTTVVNAAFLQEVKESNTQLWSVLHDLRGLSQVAPEDEEKCEAAAQQLVDGLSQLRDCVGLEFSLEETYGFIDGSNAVVSSKAGNAERAKTQHRELYLELQEICEKAEEAQYRGTICRDFPMYLGAFEHFDESFRAHEELESGLIEAGLGVARID